MPPRRTKDEIKKKQEIAAKVREIKERQQKWMNEKKETEDGAHSGKSKSTPSHQSTHTSPPGHSEILESISPERNHVEKWLHQNSTPVNPISLPSYQPSNYETPPMSSSDDFNDVADRIIHRVKDRLGVSTNYDRSPQRPHEEGYSQQTANTSHKPLTAHCCPKCQKLMISPHHSPMMLIPCGHNLCEACCRGAVTCYTCDTDIGSHTSNIMLQQIIQSKTSTDNRRVSTTPKGHQASQRDDTESEIQTLLLRKDAMEEEKSNLRHKISQINRSIEKEAAQITSIEEAESSIIKEIAQLQSKMTLLHQHKEEFREKITLYNADITSEHKKITLIDETTEYLNDQLSKLRRKV